MKTDYTKENGGIINEDVAGEYKTALRRRERNNRINELLDLLPELKELVKKMRDEKSENL